MGRSPRQAWVRDHLMLLFELFWLGSVVADVLTGMVRAWRLLYAGRQADAFWTLVHTAMPFILVGVFFYSVYRLYGWARPHLERWKPELEWPEIGFRFPWQRRSADGDEA